MKIEQAIKAIYKKTCDGCPCLIDNNSEFKCTSEELYNCEIHKIEAAKIIINSLCNNFNSIQKLLPNKD